MSKVPYDPDNPQHQAAMANVIQNKFGKHIAKAVDKIVNYVNTVARAHVLANGDTNIKQTLEEMMLNLPKDES